MEWSEGLGSGGVAASGSRGALQCGSSHWLVVHDIEAEELAGGECEAEPRSGGDQGAQGRGAPGAASCRTGVVLCERERGGEGGCPACVGLIASVQEAVGEREQQREAFEAEIERQREAFEAEHRRLAQEHASIVQQMAAERDDTRALESNKMAEASARIEVLEAARARAEAAREELAGEVEALAQRLAAADAMVLSREAEVSGLRGALEDAMAAHAQCGPRVLSLQAVADDRTPRYRRMTKAAGAS